MNLEARRASLAAEREFLRAMAPPPFGALAAAFARISASRAPPHAPISAFCGGPSPATLLSPPAVQQTLLRCLPTRAQLALRATCRDARAAVASFPFNDLGTVIRGSVASWRACYPRAIGAAAYSRNPYCDDGPEYCGLSDGRLRHLVDADFEHFRGLENLFISHCEGLSDSALAPLAGSIRMLIMEFCTSFSDAAFVHLRGIRELYMGHCDQPAITDAAIVHLAGIQVLRLSWCDQPTITPAFSVPLVGAKRIELARCNKKEHAAAARALGIPVVD